MKREGKEEKMWSESKLGKKQRKAMACTMTGEPYQPVRLYYQIKQKNALLGRFKRLRCMDFAPSRNCWVWLYQEEAKKLKFTKSYGEIPKEERPIILGALKVKSESELVVDVSSFSRAIQAILFFDEKINRRLASLEKMRIVNKLFPAGMSQSERWGHHREFFEEREVEDPQKKVQELRKIVAEEQEEQKQQELFESMLAQWSNEKLAEVEELEWQYGSEEIELLQMALTTRQMEAIEHWKGNKNVRQLDMMKRIIKERGR